MGFFWVKIAKRNIEKKYYWKLKHQGFYVCKWFEIWEDDKIYGKYVHYLYQKDIFIDCVYCLKLHAWYW